jgi:VAD1 Analog of StAR-related lipid transfer domain/GRAM domain
MDSTTSSTHSGSATPERTLSTSGGTRSRARTESQGGGTDGASADVSAAAQRQALGSQILFELFGVKNLLLLEDFSCALSERGNLLMHGRLYVTNMAVCFSSSIFGTETRRILPYSSMESINKTKQALIINTLTFTMRRKATGELKDVVFTSFFAHSRDEAYKTASKQHRLLRPELYPADGSTSVSSASLRSHSNSLHSFPLPSASADGNSGATSEGSHSHHDGASTTPPLQAVAASSGEHVRSRRGTGTASTISDDGGSTPAPLAPHDAPASSHPAPVSSTGAGAEPTPPSTATTNSNYPPAVRRRASSSAALLGPNGHSSSTAHLPPFPQDFWKGLRASGATVLLDKVIPLSPQAFFEAALADGAGFSMAEAHRSRGDFSISCSEWLAGFSSTASSSSSSASTAVKDGEGLATVLSDSEDETDEGGAAEEASEKKEGEHKEGEGTGAGTDGSHQGGQPKRTAHRRRKARVPDLLTRTLRLRMPLPPGPFVPKDTAVEKIQRLLRFSSKPSDAHNGHHGNHHNHEPCFVLETSGRTSDVPYGDSFTTFDLLVAAPHTMKFEGCYPGHEEASSKDVEGCLKAMQHSSTLHHGVAVPPSSLVGTRVVVVARVDFSKNPLFKGRISKASMEGMQAFFNHWHAGLVEWIRLKDLEATRSSNDTSRRSSQLLGAPPIGAAAAAAITTSREATATAAAVLPHDSNGALQQPPSAFPTPVELATTTDIDAVRRAYASLYASHQRLLLQQQEQQSEKSQRERGSEADGQSSPQRQFSTRFVVLALLLLLCLIVGASAAVSAYVSGKVVLSVLAERDKREAQAREEPCSRPAIDFFMESHRIPVRSRSGYMDVPAFPPAGPAIEGSG